MVNEIEEIVSENDSKRGRYTEIQAHGEGVPPLPQDARNPRSVAVPTMVSLSVYILTCFLSGARSTIHFTKRRDEFR